VVNPDIVKAQIEGGSSSESRRAVGRGDPQERPVEQSNFHTFACLRMNESPAIEVHLVRNVEAPGGIASPAPQ